MQAVTLREVTAINFYDSTPQAMLASGENITLYQAELKQLQGFARPLNAQLAAGTITLYDLIRTINAPDKVELSHRLLFNTPAYVRDGDFHDPPSNVDMQRVDKHYIGVEFIELFYSRNLRIYSNILQAQQRLGAKRILIHAGTEPRRRAAGAAPSQSKFSGGRGGNISQVAMPLLLRSAYRPARPAWRS